MQKIHLEGWLFFNNILPISPVNEKYLSFNDKFKCSFPSKSSGFCGGSNFYTKFENISCDFTLLRIFTKLKQKWGPRPSRKTVSRLVDSANYPNPQIKDLKPDTTYIQISDTGNFKATLDIFSSTMIVSVTFL